MALQLYDAVTNEPVSGVMSDEVRARVSKGRDIDTFLVYSLSGRWHPTTPDEVSKSERNSRIAYGPPVKVARLVYVMTTARHSKLYTSKAS